MPANDEDQRKEIVTKLRQIDVPVSQGHGLPTQSRSRMSCRANDWKNWKIARFWTQNYTDCFSSHTGEIAPIACNLTVRCSYSNGLLIRDTSTLKAQTLSLEIAQTLGADIVSGRAAPGSRLDEVSLAKRFSVSRTPIRDALRHLAATKLVNYVPHRGFSVAQVDRVMLQDAYEAFGMIESLCARLCSLRASATERAQIVAIHAEGKAVLKNIDTQRYSAINDAFHDAIYAGAHNKTLEKIALDMRQQLAPFRSRAFLDLDVSQKEHDAVVKAIVATDANVAATAMMQHTTRAALIVLNQLSDKPAVLGANDESTASTAQAVKRGRGRPDQGIRTSAA